MYQLYFSDETWREDVTDFFLHNLDHTSINLLLTDKSFLTEYGTYFEEGITGWKIDEENRLTIQYWSWCDTYEENTWCFKEVKVVQ